MSQLQTTAQAVASAYQADSRVKSDATQAIDPMTIIAIVIEAVTLAIKALKLCNVLPAAAVQKASHPNPILRGRTRRHIRSAMRNNGVGHRKALLAVSPMEDAFFATGRGMTEQDMTALFADVQ